MALDKMQFVVEHLDPSPRYANRLAYIIWKAFGQHTIKIACGKDGLNPDGWVFRQERLEIELQNPRARVIAVRRIDASDQGDSELIKQDESIIATLLYRVPRSVVHVEVLKAWDEIEPPQPSPPPAPADSERLLSEVRVGLNGLKERGLNEDKDFYLNFLATLPDFHNYGLGTRLMEDFHNIADAQGATSFLTTGPTRGFYERFGWIVTEQMEVNWPSIENSNVEAGRQELYSMKRFPPRES